MSKELKDCPFCGNEPELMGRGGYWWITCVCFMETKKSNAPDAREAQIFRWNQRVPASQVHTVLGVGTIEKKVGKDMSKSTYYVTEVTVCVDCHGSGVQQHPLWAMYWAEFGEEAVNRTQEQDRQWFSSVGWVGDFLPSEEDACVECDGQGKIIRQVNLKDALAACEGLE